jgi:hypothetical protein
MRGPQPSPARVEEPLAALRRACSRIAELELRALAAGEYDHAVNLHRAGAALDNVLEVAEESL